MKNIQEYIGKRDIDAIDSVGALFREVDVAADRFRDLTGIHCPDRCGQCCCRSAVETTAVEMLPLALDLWRKNEAELWLGRIAEAEGKATCVFYRADPGNPLSGRCMVYELRPLICRLFGFFTVRNKYGRYVYGSCSVIKQTDSGVYEKAVHQLDSMEHPSLYTDYSIRVIGIDSGFGFRMEPVNRAAAAAISKLGYRLELSGYVRL